MQTARLLPWIVTALLLGSCRPTTAVTVNGETVPLAEVEQAAQLAGNRSDDPQVLASIVAERLILQDTEAQGLGPASCVRPGSPCDVFATIFAVV